MCSPVTTPNHKEACLFSMYFMTNWREFRCAQLYKLALEEKPDHIQSLLSLGDLEAKSGKLLEASKLYERANKCDPQNTFAIHQLAKFYR